MSFDNNMYMYYLPLCTSSFSRRILWVPPSFHQTRHKTSLALDNLYNSSVKLNKAIEHELSKSQTRLWYGTERLKKFGFEEKDEKLFIWYCKKNVHHIFLLIHTNFKCVCHKYIIGTFYEFLQMCTSLDISLCVFMR